MTRLNPLEAASSSAYMLQSLPNNGTIKSQTEAIALACHACMLAVGFRLIGLGEEHTIEYQSEDSDVQRLPSEWNASSSYAFRYKHSQSAMEYLLKVNRLGKKAVVMGLGMGDDRTASCEFQLDSYVDKANIPFGPISDDSVNAIRNRLFVSDHHLSELGSKLDVEIIRKLMPGIHKEGYEAASATSSTQESQEQRRGQRDPIPGRDNSDRPLYDPLRDDPLRPQPARPHPFDDPLAAMPPRRPIPDFAPPGFEDEFEMQRPPRGFPPGRNPVNLGERDLYPQGLGPNDPLRGNFPRPGLGGVGGGMHPTFGDPLFQGRGPEGSEGGLFGMQAPPGARYDPVGPGMDAPRDRQGRGGFPGGGGLGGGPPNPFSGFGSGDFI